MTEWLDLALVFNPATRRTDLVLGEDGDLALDETPATPMLISLGSDRRARPDDELPSGITELNAPASFIERRGWPGDALDAQGRLIGSRLWLLDRAKSTALTRRFAEEWVKEAFGWVRDETGKAAVISVEWLSSSLLAIACSIDGRSITINKRVT